MLVVERFPALSHRLPRKDRSTRLWSSRYMGCRKGNIRVPAPKYPDHRCASCLALLSLLLLTEPRAIASDCNRYRTDSIFQVVLLGTARGSASGSRLVERWIVSKSQYRFTNHRQDVIVV